MKGFKVFNPNWTCRNFQYEVGQTYEMEASPSLCNRGFHFCQIAADCFGYYEFDLNNKVAEIEALGEIAEEGDKCSTNKIHIIREIPWSELLTTVNSGKGNSGLSNSGDWNSGDWNSGNGNSGNRNSGNGNSGNRNSGNGNSGNRNSGNGNSGNRNSGDWNSGNGNSGCFNSIDHEIHIFDKPSEMTLNEWRNTRAYRLLRNIDFRPTDWICESDMSAQEKKDHPEYETTRGYLKDNDTSTCCVEWWAGLSQNDKCTIQNIPNFDPEKFYDITGIRI
jgi:PPE-repeat protein